MVAHHRTINSIHNSFIHLPILFSKNVEEYMKIFRKIEKYWKQWSKLIYNLIRSLSKDEYNEILVVCKTFPQMVEKYGRITARIIIACLLSGSWREMDYISICFSFFFSLKGTFEFIIIFPLKFFTGVTCSETSFSTNTWNTRIVRRITQNWIWNWSFKSFRTSSI